MSFPPWSAVRGAAVLFSPVVLSELQSGYTDDYDKNFATTLLKSYILDTHHSLKPFHGLILLSVL